MERENMSYKLLTKASSGQILTVRDEHYEFPMVLDAVRRCRKRNSRFRLIDSGAFDRYQLEWLAKAGADIYSSDDVKREILELTMIQQASKMSRSILAYFFNGSFKSEQETENPVFSYLSSLGGEGLYLYISSKEEERDFKLLDQLAYRCRKAGSWLVFYHHGPLADGLLKLAENGAWIHISNTGINEEEDKALIIEITKAARLSGANLIFHLEKEPAFSFLQDVSDTGAFLLFKYSQVDYKSPLKSLERKARSRTLDPRAYYLYPELL